MKWAYEIEAIMIEYYDKQSKIGIDPNTLLPVMPTEYPDINTKKEMVTKLIEVYDKLSYSEKKDNLVPADAQFLNKLPISHKEYDSEYGSSYRFEYNFPENDGFEGNPTTYNLKQGEIYDRIGSAEGKFLSPVINGKPQSFLQRAIPYYVPEKDTDITKSPSYHRYVIIKNYSSNGLNKQVKIGKVSKCFWKNPDDGGGIQVKLPFPIEQFKDVFNEL